MGKNIPTKTDGKKNKSIIRKVRTTDKQCRYVINHILMSQIEYLTTDHILSESWLNKQDSKTRTVFEYKCNLAKITPNAIIHSCLEIPIILIGGTITIEQIINDKQYYHNIIKSLKANNLMYADQLINNNPKNIRILTWAQVTKKKYPGRELYWYKTFEKKLMEAEFNFTQQYDYINTFNPLENINNKTKFTVTQIKQANNQDNEETTTFPIIGKIKEKQKNNTIIIEHYTQINNDNNNFKSPLHPCKNCLILKLNQSLESLLNFCQQKTLVDQIINQQNNENSNQTKLIKYLPKQIQEITNIGNIIKQKKHHLLETFTDSSCNTFKQLGESIKQYKKVSIIKNDEEIITFNGTIEGPPLSTRAELAAIAILIDIISEQIRELKPHRNLIPKLLKKILQKYIKKEIKEIKKLVIEITQDFTKILYKKWIERCIKLTNGKQMQALDNYLNVTNSSFSFIFSSLFLNLDFSGPFETCNKCHQNNIGFKWCHPCNAKQFQNEFGKWTSEDREIDEFIQQIQLNANKYRLKGQNVFLKSLDNSTNKIDFLQGINNQLKFRGKNAIAIYGITKNPTKNEYMIVMKYAKYEVVIGLINIHEMGLMHKDFHSGNIVNQSLSLSYITDFGLCKPVTENDPENIYETLSRGEYTQASDIYSFGIVMLEVLTSYPPYYDIPHDVNLVIKICKGLKPEIKCEIPQFLKEIMEKCWNFEPLNCPTAKELKFQLEKYHYDDGKIRREVNNQVQAANKSNKNFIQYDPNKMHPKAIYTSRNLSFLKIKKVEVNTHDTKQLDLLIPDDIIEENEIQEN
ncbi:hypothetical protein Glove_355g51 [Diversispora epigaea]|uniref:Protein kinase domain-containing protein n=1 Tax=Diversispora epigaea TaxID=1348612 RepID=A0A397HE46_9GLOM|nr:hypothetical protein Glove_355g51 [Diversispora epigaea]